MLNAIRKRSGSIVVKGLLILLILSFAVWGIGDYVTGGQDDQVAATVGDTEIPSQEVEFQLNNEIQRLSQQLGGSLTPAMIEQLRNIGLVQDVLRRSIEQALLREETNDLKMVVTDDMIRADIQSNPAFHNSLGQFDRNVFAATLRNAGMNEGLYINLAREDIARSTFLETLMASVQTPRVIATEAYTWGREERMAETVAIISSDLPAPAEPTEAELAAYHEANPAAFTAPEYRTAKALVFTAKDLAAGIEVSEDELREAYQERINAFTTPERRTVSQIIINEETEARALHVALLGGGDFLQAGLDAGLAESAIKLGEVTKNDMLPDLADVVFALSEDAVSEPVQSPFGWHIFHVTEIKSGGSVSFEEAREELARTLAHDLAVDALYDTSTRVEDALGGGATIEEAASQLGLPLLDLAAIDAQGNGPDGQAISGLPEGTAFLPALFELLEGEESQMTDTGADGYFVARIDGITPPALRPLDDVRGEVREAVLADKRATAARTEAETLAEAVNTGADLDELAGQAGLEVTALEAATRSGEGLPIGAVDVLFGLEPGKAGVVDTENGAMLIKLTDIKEADPVAGADGIEAFSRQMKGGFEQDMINLLTVALQQRHPVSINQRALQYIVDPSASPRAQGAY
ncbi:MAG: peptidyl-prolyl cis-trans isomerase [Magnetovibrionaceae bacterium]